MVMATFRAPITQACPAACLMRGVVLEVALGGGPSADGAGTGGVPDLGQVPQPGPGVVAPALEPMVTRVGGQRVQGDDQVRPGSRGAQPPAAVAAGRAVPADRSEGEPGVSWRAGAGAFPVTPGFRTRAAVGDGVALVVGDGEAPGGLRVLRGGGGQVAGQPGVDRAEPREFAGPAGEAGQGGQRGGQGDPAGEPGRCRTDRAGLGPGWEPAGREPTGRESWPRSRSR